MSDSNKLNAIAARASRLSELAANLKEYESLRKQTKATREKIARKLRGQPKSDLTRRRMSKARRRYLRRLEQERRRQHQETTPVDAPEV